MTTVIVKKKQKTSTRITCRSLFASYAHGIIEKNCNPGIKCSVFFAMVANVVPVMTQTRKHGIVKSNPRVHRLDKEGL